MYWNYRIVKLVDGSGYALKEVYYDNDGTPTGMCSHHLDVGAESDDSQPIKTIANELQRVLHDITNPKVPIFEEPKEWADNPAAAVLNHTLAELFDMTGN